MVSRVGKDFWLMLLLMLELRLKVGSKNIRLEWLYYRSSISIMMLSLSSMEAIVKWLVGMSM